MTRQRLIGAIAEFIAAIVISFLFAQVAARIVPLSDKLFFTICTVGAYILGLVGGVYFTAEILDQKGNFWFLVVGAVFGGIVVFVAYSFEVVLDIGLWDGLSDYITSVTLAGSALATFAFNIGPKAYGRR
ncbi:MAG: hypothetical protein WA996_21960 [Candidatus Promineifilaceae bacterium]